LKHKPLTLIEGNNEIDSELFYEKINKIIEEERKKNADIRAFQSHRDEVKFSS
jgi:hypothetical protein